MSTLTQLPVTDTEGFLINPSDWTEEFAQHMANKEGVTLTDRHWVIINYMRAEFFKENQTPTVRKITKAGIADTKEIYALFPGGPAKIPAKIGGIPKPKGCI